MSKATLRVLEKNLPNRKQRDFASELVMIHAKAHAIGLHRTGHALHEAVRQCGWELAEMAERSVRHVASKRKGKK